MISKSELKFIRSLKNKKYRTSEKRFLVEGAKNVQELLKSDFEIEILLASDDFYKSNLESDSTHRIERVSPKVLTDVSSIQTNGQALAVVHQKEYTLSDFDFEKTSFAFDGLNDPGNLGTIIRTLDWFGHKQILCSDDSVELYNPKVISSTMGSFCRVKVIYCDMEKTLSSYKGGITGAEMIGDSLGDWNPSAPEIIVMGSESHGIRDGVRKHLDRSITIPGSGNAESLNVGVATGIICSHVWGRNPAK